MTRRCSHCSNNGHNSRTCPTRGGTTASGVSNSGVKLFGVRLIDGTMMKKSASMSNLSLHIHSSSLNPGSPSSDPVAVADGYLSDDLAHGSSNRRAERKKGVPWTEEEHRLFLIGLHKLGKGDWRGIARHYVKTRTPTQVASHAQKFFIRQSNVGRRRRRSSLFDMSADVEIDAPLMPDESAMPPLPLKEDDNSNSMPSLNLSLSSEFDSMEKDQEFEESHLPPHEAFPLFLPGGIVEAASASACYPHQILKPIPLLLKEPVNVDTLVGMSHLSLVEDREPSPLSLKPSRQSAFHVSSGSRFLIPQIRNH